MDIKKNDLNNQLDQLSKNIIWNRTIRENLEHFLISYVKKERENVNLIIV